MAEPDSYTVRANAFTGRRTFRLTDNALTWEEDGKPLDGVFYDDVAEVRMRYAPSRAWTNRYVAQILFREGGMVELSNMDFVGFANMREQNADYAAFLRAFHRRLAERNATAIFRKGSSAAAYAGNLALTAFILAMIVLAAVLLVTWGFVWIAAVKLVIVVLFVPVLFRFIRRAKPETYDPRALPADALPAA
jgi:hypothetical protein